MKQRFFSVALAVCLFISSQSVTGAEMEASLLQEVSLSQEEGALPEEALPGDEVSLPEEETVPPDEGALPEDEASLPEEETVPSEEGALPGDEVSLPEEETMPPEEGALPGDEVSLPEEETVPPEDEASLPEEETSSREEAVLCPEVSVLKEKSSEEAAASMQTAATENTVPTPTQAYEAMIALQSQDAYKEGTPWTNDEPYSDSKGYYRWKGGTLNGTNIVAVGCVAFAFILSDAAFGSLPARMYAAGGFAFEDIKAGDILRVNNDVHTVIVLEVNDAGVVVAEGNISSGDHKGKVHWGRAISREEVMSSTSHYITRYPEGYIPPDDPSANVSIAGGDLGGGLTWNLTKAGTLTISGSGAMADYSSMSEQPWNAYSSQIRTVIIEEGVTGIGACAFWECGVLSAAIPASVAAIGNSAFRGSSIISVTIPSGVKTIGDSAFSGCPNLSTVALSEGVETISQNAFQACTNLDSIAFPASIGEVGAGAFFQCQALKTATFAPGSKQVKLGDNLFTQCYDLTSVTLPQSIDRIGEGMFQKCMLLSRVDIPQGAGSIGGSAFASCSSLTTVVIPDSVTTIGIAAFSACSLKDIYFTGTEAQWNSISKIGDTAAAVANASVHYEYSPEPSTTPGPSTTPEPSTTPGPSTTPEPSATPGPSTTPEPPTTPGPSTTPEPSATPGPSASPGPTQTPGQTTSPEPTVPPKPSTVPEQSPTPLPAVPSISGESGKEGWAAIRDETANASEGQRLHVIMNGAKVVPGDVLDSIKGQDVTISFDMGNGIVWSVNGRNVTAEHANNVNLSVQVGTSAVPQDIVNQISGERQTIQLSLAHSGDFGYSAVFTLNVDPTHAGLYANLFYYNEGAGRLEFVTADQINEDGITELVFTHASDYIIVIGEDVMKNGNDGTSSGDNDESAPSGGDSSQKEEARSPKTGEADSVTADAGTAISEPEGSRLNYVWLLSFGTAGLAAAGALAFLFRKRAVKKGAC